MEDNKISENPEEGQKKSKIGRYIKIFFLLCLIVLGIVLYFVWLYFKKPSTAVIRVSNNISNKEVEKIEFERFEGEFVSFAHQSSYLVKMHEKEPDKNGLVLERAFLSNDSSNPKKIALTVESLVERPMEETGSYNMREKTPDKFKKETFQIEDKIQGVVFMAKEDDFFEKTIFIPKSGYLVVISLNSIMKNDETLNDEFEKILESVQFKK